MYPLQESKVKCWPLYSAHIKYSEREMSALRSAPRVYYHLFIFNTNTSGFQPTGHKANTADRYFILTVVREAQQPMCYWHRTIYLNKDKFWFFLTLTIWWKWRVWGAYFLCLVCVELLFSVLGKFALRGPHTQRTVTLFFIRIKAQHGRLPFNWNKTVPTIAFFERSRERKWLYYPSWPFHLSIFINKFNSQIILNCQWKYRSCLQLCKRSLFPFLLITGVWSFGRSSLFHLNKLSSKQVGFERGDYLVWCYWFFSWHKKV